MNSNIRPPTKTCIDPEHHASLGTGKRYPFETRTELMWTYDNDRRELNTPYSRAKQEAHVLASWPTIYRWVARRTLLGHFCPLKRTGNIRATRELRTDRLVDLALYRSVMPKAYLYKIRAFLFNRCPLVDPYSNSQVHRAETLLELTRKQASTTAN